MGTWDINLEKQTVASINGITFKITKIQAGWFSRVCLNPKDISPDDLDDVILARMIKDAGMFNEVALKGEKG